MTERSHEQCEDLHKALEDARSRLAPPQRDTSLQGVQAPVVLDPLDTTPDARPEVHEEIRELEKAIRNAGCDPAAWEPGEDRFREGYGNRESPALPDEQEQRELMLRHMAEQREDLRSDGLDMPDEDDTIGEPVEQELGRMERGADRAGAGRRGGTDA